MTEIGVFQAKNTLSALLDRVEKGEEIVITRKGKAVAKLVPTGELDSRAAARETMRQLRALAEEMRLGPYNWEEWKDFRDRGRR
jgi:prevent-host-death family protein